MAIYTRLDGPGASEDSPIFFFHLPVTGVLGLRHYNAQINVGSRDLNSNLHMCLASMLTHFSLLLKCFFIKPWLTGIVTNVPCLGMQCCLWWNTWKLVQPTWIHQLPSRLNEGFSISQGGLWRGVIVVWSLFMVWNLVQAKCVRQQESYVRGWYVLLPAIWGTEELEHDRLRSVKWLAICGRKLWSTDNWVKLWVFPWGRPKPNKAEILESLFWAKWIFLYTWIGTKNEAASRGCWRRGRGRSSVSGDCWAQSSSLRITVDIWIPATPWGTTRL